VRDDAVRDGYPAGREHVTDASVLADDACHERYIGARVVSGIMLTVEQLRGRSRATA
jgi:hypothetical protein